MLAARLLGRVLWPLLFDLHVHGRHHVPRRGAVMLAANHSGWLDGPMVFVVAPRSARFLVKSELYAGRLGRVLDWLGQIPINRGRPDRRALRRGLETLAAGRALGMFPEGTRGEGRVDEVQHGIAYLAVHAACPIVPVACFGTAEALPRGGRPRLRTRIDIVFGAPFTVDVAGDVRSRRTVALAADQIRERLAAHLADASGENTGKRP
jgi:1-acyl-sn-glycerol-3-phosphate acyltransferase